MTALPDDPGFGVYVHWPYCAAICPYCAFNVVRDRGRGGEQQALLDAILRDLETTAGRTGSRPMRSLYLGGGTPSRLEPAAVARLIERASALWTPEPGFEVTLEANPDDCDAARLEGFAEAGVTRLSLGVQALVDADLKALGRWHSADDARAAVARSVEIMPRVSLDLIYARPGQTPEAWADELRDALALGAEHVSLYELTIEPGTAFAMRASRGELPPTDDERGADFLAANVAVAEAAGFEAYEVSNYAKGVAARSAHNLIYWRSGEWAGVGPGAHGRRGALGAARIATAAEPDLAAYVRRVAETGTGVAEEETLDEEAQSEEALLMGLRLAEGIPLDRLALVGGVDAASLAALEHEGLLVRTAGRLKVAREGRGLVDRIVLELVS
jgi:oxygen-independent coproporphyrinogen-3 oxidase